MTTVGWSVSLRRRPPWLLILFALQLLSCGHTADETYECSVKNGKQRGTGSFTTFEGDEYSGELTEGKPHGHGVYEFSGGARFEGEFREGKKHGPGVYEFENGDVYEGSFRFDLGHGHGVLHYANGATYVGNFEADRRHGFGIYTVDETTYQGEFHEGKKQGRGALSTETSEYCGEFKQGKPFGHGVHTMSNNDRFEGIFAPPVPPFGQISRPGILWGHTVIHTGYLGGQDLSLARDGHYEDEHKEAVSAAVRAREVERETWAFVEEQAEAVALRQKGGEG